MSISPVAKDGGPGKDVGRLPPGHREICSLWPESSQAPDVLTCSPAAGAQSPRKGAGRSTASARSAQITLVPILAWF